MDQPLSYYLSFHTRKMMELGVDKRMENWYYITERDIT